MYPELLRKLLGKKCFPADADKVGGCKPEAAHEPISTTHEQLKRTAEN